MKKCIIGKKIGMTQLFDENGNIVPVTVVEAGPCVVVQRKTTESDGYEAVVAVDRAGTVGLLEAVVVPALDGAGVALALGGAADVHLVGGIYNAKGYDLRHDRQERWRKRPF